MGEWFSGHWFDCIQTLGIVAGFIFSAYTLRKDERARQITNTLEVSDRYGRIWQAFYDKPELSRVLQKDVDLKSKPVTDQEWLFVKMLILHLDTVRRAMNAGLFVEIKGLESDVREFFSLPVPQAVWHTVKPLQNKDFAAFIDSALK